MFQIGESATCQQVNRHRRMFSRIACNDRRQRPDAEPVGDAIRKCPLGNGSQLHLTLIVAKLTSLFERTNVEIQDLPPAYSLIYWTNAAVAVCASASISQLQNARLRSSDSIHDADSSQ